MKKAICFSVMFLLLMGYYSPIAEGAHHKWNNGGINNFFNSNCDGGEVRNNTTLNISGNSEINPGALEVYDTSIVNVLGSASYINILKAYANSEINISNGTVGLYNCADYSRVNVFGGFVKPGEGGTGGIYASGFSELNILGGQFTGKFICDGNAKIIFNGSGFKIDGIDVGFGQYFVSDFVGGSGTLTGTLDSGTSLNNPFKIYKNYVSDNASIILIPEPTTLLLFGLGTVMLRRKRRLFLMK